MSKMVVFEVFLVAILSFLAFWLNIIAAQVVMAVLLWIVLLTSIFMWWAAGKVSDQALLDIRASSEWVIAQKTYTIMSNIVLICIGLMFFSIGWYVTAVVTFAVPFSRKALMNRFKVILAA